VVKALSWALRALARREPDAVRRFVAELGGLPAGARAPRGREPAPDGEEERTSPESNLLNEFSYRPSGPRGGCSEPVSLDDWPLARVCTTMQCN